MKRDEVSEEAYKPLIKVRDEKGRKGNEYIEIIERSSDASYVFAFHPASRDRDSCSRLSDDLCFGGMFGAAERKCSS